MKESKEVVYEELFKKVEPEPNLIDYGLAVKLDDLSDLELNWILVRACEEQETRIIKFFVRRFKRIGDGLPEKVKTAIHVAARLNLPVCFDLLTQIYDNHVNHVDPDDADFSHFQAACKMGHAALAESLLVRGVHEDVDSILGVMLKSRPDARVLELLLSSGARPNLADANGTSLLSSYCRQFCSSARATESDKAVYLELVRTLLRHQANVNFMNNEGVSPMQNLYRHGILAADLQLAVLKLLLEAGADVHYRSKSGETILHYVLRRRYLGKCHGKVFDLPRRTPEVYPVLELLVRDHRADVNVKDYAGESPLSLAVSTCNLDGVLALLKLGADPRTVTFQGGFLDPANEYLRNLETTQNMLEIVELLKQNKYAMEEKHEAWVLRFLLGFPPATAHFNAAYVIALASNASVIRNHCAILTTFDNEIGPVIGALSNHLKAVDFGKMYMNERAKDAMIEVMQNLEEASDDNSSSEDELDLTQAARASKFDMWKIQDSAILEEIKRARRTMISQSASLLDLCSCAPDKAYPLLEGTGWQALLLDDTEEKFSRLFTATGPTIKGYICRALVRKYFDSLRPEVAAKVLADEYF
ncbi:hypothetical protein TKK_0011836 [Trichogramma kaykai]